MNMTDQEIVSGNKLIAEFMGYEYIPSPVPVVRNELTKQFGWSRTIEWHPFFIKTMGDDFFPPQRYYLGRSHHDLIFHRDWSWLMPVVEKIESLEYEFIIYGKQFGQFPRKSTTVIYFDLKRHGRLGDIRAEGETSIETTHQAIVEFIKWYNENKK